MSRRRRARTCALRAMTWGVPGGVSGGARRARLLSARYASTFSDRRTDRPDRSGELAARRRGSAASSSLLVVLAHVDFRAIAEIALAAVIGHEGLGVAHVNAACRRLFTLAGEDAPWWRDDASVAGEGIGGAAGGRPNARRPGAPH